MIFKRETKDYSVLYKNYIGALDVGVFTINGSKKELRKSLEKKGLFVQKIINLELILAKSKSITWSSKELFSFTNKLRLELSKRSDEVVSIKSAVSEVYKKTFDPVVYAILIELNENRKFENIIRDFPNVFDEVYMATIEAYFKIKHKPEDGLIKLEEHIIEKQEFKRKIIDGVRVILVSLSMAVLLSFVMDIIIYERIQENFQSFGRTLPDFTIFYHNLLYYTVILIGPFFMLYGLANLYYSQLTNIKIKIKIAQLRLAIPFYGDIHKKRTVYEFIDTFQIMKESDVLQRDLLRILSISSSNFYLGEILKEVREETKSGETVGKALEEYGYFTGDDDDVIHALKGSNINESLISLRKVKKVELDQLAGRSLRSIITVTFIITLLLIGSMGKAYYGPVQMQSKLFKDRINEEKEQSLNQE